MHDILSVMEPTAINRLEHAESLYLRQHAHQPVDWWTWSPEALDEARRYNRPILLSIGYAACHWCHVMAHECFDNEAIAARMNTGFLCIKLDREERPDIDANFQRAHEVLNGRGGGWPLTVFLDPEELVPFFIGTYFPSVARHGLPAFGDVLQAVGRAWREQHENLLRQGKNLCRALAGPSPSGVAEYTDLVTLEQIAWNQIRSHYDPVHGGHRGQPKFPPHIELAWLLARDTSLQKEAESARSMAENTLEKMARSGLRDHLDGGFFRYCVDATWTIPHFEKMLCDNAQLLETYARAAVTCTRPDFAGIATDIAGWLENVMRLDDDGWAASIDADSEGGEGAWYVWTTEQVSQCLDADSAAIFTAHYGLDQPPNFDSRAWHLQEHRDTTAPMHRPESKPDRGSPEHRLADARDRLREKRQQRPPPTRDDKRLTAWNALTVRSLARASRHLAAPDMLEAAEHGLRALRCHAWRDGRLHGHSGQQAPEAFLSDYALLISALLDMLACRWSDQDLFWAQKLTSTMLELFGDSARGGLYESSIQHSTPLGRTMSWFDSNVPSGNALAADTLCRIGHLLARSDWLDVAAQCIKTGLDTAAEMPYAATALLQVRRNLEHPAPLLILRGNDSDLETWQTALDTVIRSGLPIYSIPDSVESLPPVLAAYTPRNGGVAYLCVGMHCLTPQVKPEDLLVTLHDLLNEPAPARNGSSG